MNTERLLRDIQAEEGFKPYIYRCTAGYLTMGFGMKVSNVKVPLEVWESTLKYYFPPVPIIRRETALHDLKVRLEEIILNSNIQFVLDELDDVRAEVIINMCYQMGVDGVLKFKRMITALMIHDYKGAAREGLDSKWAEQTPARAARLMERIRTGQHE
jgi:lysozyme